MNTEQFYKIFDSAQIGTALLIIAGSLVAIAYILAIKYTPNKKSHR